MLRQVATVILGTALIAAASWIAPSPTHARAGEELILSAGDATVISLGRTAAAGDVAWLFVVQLIGDANAEAAGWPSLARWTRLMNGLSPRFEMGYWATALLLASSRQADEAKAVTDRARDALDPAWCRREDICPTPKVLRLDAYLEEHCQPCELLEPCDFDLERWPGYVEYFGRGDALAAADHFCEARRRGGPGYLHRMAVRLATTSQTCANLSQDLAAAVQGQRDGILGQRAQSILESCLVEELERASAAFRITLRRPPESVEQLLEEGFIEERPIQLPGRCFVFDGPRVHLEDCKR